MGLIALCKILFTDTYSIVYCWSLVTVRLFLCVPRSFSILTDYGCKPCERGFIHGTNKAATVNVTVNVMMYSLFQGLTK